MPARMRSPNYPSTSLKEAIDLAAKIFSSERTNPVDRAVAAQAMGYSGISGRSGKVLSNLLQYGLLEKAGKNEVRVTVRARDILHPDAPESRDAALRAAASEPDLFQRINERFPDGRPSAAALRSYFVREDFTDAAIPKAIRAYLETRDFLEGADVTDGDLAEPDAYMESQENQVIISEIKAQSSGRSKNAPKSVSDKYASAGVVKTVSGPDFRWADGKIWLMGGVVATKKQADDMIAFVNAVRNFLADDQDEQDDEDRDEGGLDPDDDIIG